MPTWIPDGYTALAPYLVCADAQPVVDFMTQAFGATELRRYETPDGGILHAEYRIGDTVVMIGEAGEGWPPSPCHLHLYVEDVDATFRQAVEAGGVPLREPVRREGDPDRRGGVRDPGDNQWWIATQVEAG